MASTNSLDSLLSKWRGLRRSLRWLVGAVLLGYVPLFVIAALEYSGVNGDRVAGATLAWGLWITLPCTLLALVLAFYQVFDAMTD